MASHQTSRSSSIVLAGLLVALLSACGQKGPLTLATPAVQQAAPKASQTPAAAAQRASSASSASSPSPAASAVRR